MMTALPVSPWLIGAVIFIFGAIVGSFLNVCIVRLPKDESVVHPPSHCPKCGVGIPFYDNIPLISYILLLGRCRSCREWISARYFLVELLMASLAVGLYYEFGLGLAFVVSFVFVAALIVISFIDLAVRIVPDVISLPGIVAGLLTHRTLHHQRSIRTGSIAHKRVARGAGRRRIFTGAGVGL